jgi:hypothetical protein
MKIAACVIGMLGGFFGIYFAQLLVTATAVLGVLAGAFGSRGTDSSTPFYLGLLALFFYTLGVSGGVVALVRPSVAALLLLVAGVGGLGASVAVGPAVTSLFGQPQASPTPTPRPFVTLVPIATPRTNPPATLGTNGSLVIAFPFVGPVLLISAAALAGLAARRAERAGSLKLATTSAVIARRGEVASPAPVPLLSGPTVSSRSASGELAPGTRFDVLEQYGGFVHIRGAGFEGYLPTADVRLL